MHPKLLGGMRPHELRDHHIKKLSRAKCRRYTRRAVRDVSVWTCRVGGFTALQAPGCCLSDRWKIVPTSNLWTGSNGKAMKMAADHTCQATAQNPSFESDVCLMLCCCFSLCFWHCSVSFYSCFYNMIFSFYLDFLNIWLLLLLSTFLAFI